MSKFVIVFMDGGRVEVEALGFSVAKAIAAHKRVIGGAVKHTELTADDKASSVATKQARDDAGIV